MSLFKGCKICYCYSSPRAQVRAVMGKYTYIQMITYSFGPKLQFCHFLLMKNRILDELWRWCSESVSTLDPDFSLILRYFHSLSQMPELARHIPRHSQPHRWTEGGRPPDYISRSLSCFFLFFTPSFHLIFYASTRQRRPPPLPKSLLHI